MERRRLTPRRTSLAGFALLTLLAGVTGCSDEGAAGAAVIESSVARASVPASRAAEGGAVVRHVGVALYPAMAEEAGNGNLAFSPASITMALGMTRAGAQGESARQIDALLGVSESGAAHEGLNGLDRLLATRSGTRKNDKDQDAEITLSMANSLWAQQGASWEPPFLDTLKQQYGIGVRTVDYEGDASGAREAVNGWVADQTRDHIRELIPDGVFKPRTRLTLVNALYLAAPWARSFDEWRSLPFTTLSGRKVQAPMMHESTLLRAVSGPGWQAVTIPYAGDELAMTLVVPDAGRFAAVEADLDDETLHTVLTGGRETAVELTMPRFDLQSRPDLAKALQAAGVTAPFVTDRDFDPMSTDPDVRPLRLAAAVHQATVTVDEEGTVATAATGMVFEKVSAMIGNVTLVVDRPFLFVIHDVETATPLFIGRVADPTRK